MQLMRLFSSRDGPISSWVWSHLEGILSLDQTIVDLIYVSALLGYFDARWPYWLQQQGPLSGSNVAVAWGCCLSLGQTSWTSHSCCHVDSDVREGTVLAPELLCLLKLCWMVPLLEWFHHNHRTSQLVHTQEWMCDRSSDTNLSMKMIWQMSSMLWQVLNHFKRISLSRVTLEWTHSHLYASVWSHVVVFLVAFSYNYNGNDCKKESEEKVLASYYPFIQIQRKKGKKPSLDYSFHPEIL